MVAAASCSAERDAGGEPERCTTKQECSAGVCDLTAGTCVECLRTEDCRGDASCKDRRCVPRTRCGNTFDCPEGQVCGRSEGYCAECFGDADCSDGGCLNEVCRPHCESDKDCLEFEQLCDFARSLCVDCVTDGDCEQSEYCGNGACQPDVCSAGGTVCNPEGSAVLRCAANGSSELSEPCGFQELCVESGGAAECVPLVCFPGSFTCDADATEVVLCSEDGLTFEGVESCSDDDEVCIAGECVEPVCEAGEIVCSGKNILVCDATRTDVELIGVCSEGTYCEPTNGSCVPGACTPGDKVCTKDGVAICTAEASGFDELFLCGQDEGCLNGACVPIICEPGASFCDAGHVWQCNQFGTSNQVIETCGLDQYCDDDTAKCAPRVCEPGAQFCGDDGNARKCNTVGDGSSIATSCSESQVCVMKGGTASCASGGAGAGGEGG
jgi:hypothetical protein